MESVENEKLEETVVEVLNKIDLNVSNNDIEACHRLGKQKNKSRKTIIRFVNKKFAKKALLNRKGLKHADTSSFGLDSHEVFINENLTRANSKIAFHSRSLKRNSLIDKCYTKDGVVHIVCPDLQNGEVIKVFHLNTLMDLFPNLFLIGESLITCIGKNCSPTYYLPFKIIVNFFLSNCLMQWEKGLKYDKIHLHCVFLNHINALLAIFE